MKVQPIDNNVTAFGAKIRFAKPELKSVVKTSEKEFAKSLLDRFEAYHPKETVLFDLIETSDTDKALVARNISSDNPRAQLTRRLTPKECKNPLDGCKTFYDMLEMLLDKTEFVHSIFWKKGCCAQEQLIPFDPEGHSIFQ